MGAYSLGVSDQPSTVRMGDPERFPYYEQKRRESRVELAPTEERGRESRSLLPEAARSPNLANRVGGWESSEKWVIWLLEGWWSDGIEVGKLSVMV